MRVLVPFGARDPKSRLAPIFSPDERREFAETMLADVLAALAAHEPVVVADTPVEIDVPTCVDDRPLTTAVNARLGEEPTAVVMADLPLVRAETVARLFDTDADVVVAPGLGGGTNALVVRNADFETDYHGVSVRDHCEQAHAVDATVTTVDSYRLGVDIDEPADLVEVLLHGEGKTATWLREHGGQVETTNGRARFTRNTPD
ncbi:MAG: 2-phospho-L-lactate guanylyltransferase [Halobacteriales archaeon]|nr:2-phospho-L-lactate guanylyltransferase [Halobacteriales archaeon]